MQNKNNCYKNSSAKVTEPFSWSYQATKMKNIFQMTLDLIHKDRDVKQTFENNIGKCLKKDEINKWESIYLLS